MNRDKFQMPADLYGRDFHTLSWADVERIIAAADAAKYRAPKSASGSRARYFHAACERARGNNK